MRDRVRLMGGSVGIESPQNGGVVLEARFATARPVREREYFPAHAGSRHGAPSNH